MGVKKPITPGERFGQLTVIRGYYSNPGRGQTVECTCACGKSITLPAASLRSGNSKACGRCKSVDTEEEFFGGLIQFPETRCMLWPYGTDKNGYGKAYSTALPRGQVLAHRLAAYLTCKIPSLEACSTDSEYIVRHTCDTPACCNPDHLVIGTQADNCADAMARGRTASGSKLPQTKLTDHEVVEIRQRWASGTVQQKQLAAEYGVSRSSVCQLLNPTKYKQRRKLNNA